MACIQAYDYESTNLIIFINMNFFNRPEFSQSPEEQQNLNSVSTTVTSRFSSQTSTPSYQSSFNSQSSRFNSGLSTFSTTTQSSLFPSLSLLSSSSFSSAASWFAECNDLGFSPDPASCHTFYRCTNNYAYK